MGEILLKNDILLKNERVLKDRIQLELLKRMKSNEILTKTHGIDKYQIKELLDLLFRLLYAECKNDNKPILFTAMP